MLLAVGACAGQVPVQEFRDYAQAAEEINKTTLRLLDDYEKGGFDASAEEETAENSQEESPPSFEPVNFRPGGADAASISTDSNIQARVAAINAIREYNATMLFLANGGSVEVAKQRVGTFMGFVSTVFPAAGSANGLVTELVGKLEQARSAEQFRNAFRAAQKLPGDNCGPETVAEAKPAAQAAADQAAPANGTPPADGGSNVDAMQLTDAEKAAACMALLPGMYKILLDDTRSFYFIQKLSVSGRSQVLRKTLNRELDRLDLITQNLKRPESGANLERLLRLEIAIQTIRVQVSRAAEDDPFVFKTSPDGETMGEQTLDVLAESAAALAPLGARRVELVAALNDYHAELGRYVGLIYRAQAHLKRVEDAIDQKVDNVARIGEIARVGLDLQSDAIGSRIAFERLSSILLGTPRT